MADSTIQWTTKTWNPTVGCDKVSEGCRNCYAMRLAPRLAAMGQTDYAGLTKRLPDGSVNWTGVVRALPDRLTLPLTWKKPSRIFVDSMSDLFHEDVPDEFIDQVFAVMAWAHHHTFQILTKRPARMLAYMSAPDRLRQIENEMCGVCVGQEGRLCGFGNDDCQLDVSTVVPLPNVWLGTSVEDQRAADERIPLLLKTPAAVRFLSCEPLIGPVDLTKFIPHVAFDSGIGRCQLCSLYLMDPIHRHQDLTPGIQWCIVGGESGPGARPFNVDWARRLITQCRFAGVAPFVKQLGAHPRNSVGKPFDWLRDGGHHGDIGEWPEELRVREFPEPARELAHA